MVRVVVAFLALALLWPAAALAERPDTVWLEELTWTELRDLIAAGTTTIIVPVGGVEQSGPDMALGKHDARVRVLAESIARALGHTLVAPVIAYVPEGSVAPPTAHMRFPGTITVPPEVFRKTLESAGASFKLHGFKDIVLIGDHGGYQSELATVAADLNRQWMGTPVRAHFIADYYKAATTDFYPVLKAHGYTPAEIGTHAGAADTSLMIALDPRFVRAEELKGGAHLDVADGVYGDPRRSSAAMGQLAVAGIVQQTTTAIKAAIERPRQP